MVSAHKGLRGMHLGGPDLAPGFALAVSCGDGHACPSGRAKARPAGSSRQAAVPHRPDKSSRAALGGRARVPVPTRAPSRSGEPRSHLFSQVYWRTNILTKPYPHSLTSFHETRDAVRRHGLWPFPRCRRSEWRRARTQDSLRTPHNRTAAGGPRFARGLAGSLQRVAGAGPQRVRQREGHIF